MPASEVDHYEQLKVTATATATEIKSAYRKLGAFFFPPCSPQLTPQRCNGIPTAIPATKRRQR